MGIKEKVMTNNDKRVTRRQTLGGWLRGAALAGLAGLGLAAGRGAEGERPTCIDPEACGGCGQVRRCGLPPAQTYRHRQRDSAKRKSAAAGEGT